MILLKSFLADSRGNIAMMTAVSLVTIITAVGAAIDMARLTQAAGELQDLTDATALAIIQDTNGTPATHRDDFEDLMMAEISSRPILSGLEFDLTTEETQSGITLNVTSRSEAGLFFGDLWGGRKNVAANSEVVLGTQTLEMSLVLDISSSMTDARLTELQAASKLLITELLDNASIKDKVSISLVPFGGTVRLPSNLENMLIEPPTTEHWVDGEWNGCFRMVPQDYQGGIWPSDTFEYSPHFYGFDRPELEPWCPVAGNELMGLTNDQDALFETIDNFHRSNGTGTDIGVAWGYASLNPNWRGRFENTVRGTPRAFTQRTRKVMVVMSDGGVTGQNYPSPSDLTGTLPYRATETIATETEAQAGYEGICDTVKSRGVQIYTIGFDIRQAAHENSLSQCATDEASHFSADGGELVEVFRDIALAVDPVRLSR